MHAQACTRIAALNLSEPNVSCQPPCLPQPFTQIPGGRVGQQIAGAKALARTHQMVASPREQYSRGPFHSLSHSFIGARLVAPLSFVRLVSCMSCMSRMSTAVPVRVLPLLAVTHGRFPRFALRLTLCGGADSRYSPRAGLREKVTCLS